jgi:tetratricopeptide (TPR) repeat protein
MHFRARQAWRPCAPAVRMAAAALFGLAASIAAATPWIPADDATVLEHVPARSDLERLAPLRAAVAARPRDLQAALALASGYIDIGRRNSDPRFVAYAQAILLPWVSRAGPPEPALVLQAIALQYLHQFDAALALLERAIALVPLDGQAWLTRAALLELRGDYGGARRACARLMLRADEFAALTCLASVNGRSGELAASYATLQDPSGLDPRLPAALRAWRLSVLAEMAERLGDDAAAEAHLTAALRASGDDPYLKAAYADLLLRRNRSAEVIALLRANEAQDPLLLRLAIAGRRSGNPEAARWAQLYEQRLRAAARDGDASHQREQAMYLLEVREDVRAALVVAAQNWCVQREPADVRVYAQAAARAGSGADLAAIVRWRATSHYEDHTLPLPGPAATAGPP